MEEYNFRKEKGKNRSDPDRKKSWKEYITEHSKSKRSQNTKKHAKIRNKTVNEEENTKDKSDDRKECLIKNGPWYHELTSKYKGIKYYKLMRTGRYCKKCECVVCEHRAVESALLIILSQKKKDGSFSNFPKEIAVMIAKEVYTVKMRLVEEMNYLGIIPTTSIWREF